MFYWSGVQLYIENCNVFEYLAFYEPLERAFAQFFTSFVLLIRAVYILDIRVYINTDRCDENAVLVFLEKCFNLIWCQTFLRIFLKTF